MGIIYSGQNIVVPTPLAGDTAISLIGAVQAALIGNGWTTIGGNTTPGIVPIRLRSALTPQGMQGDIWMRQVGNNAVFNASSVNATNYNTPNLAMGDSALIPGTGFQYQIIHNPYYFYLFRLVTPCPSQQSFMFMAPYVPPFLNGLVYESVLAQYGLDPYELTKGPGLFSASSTYSQLNGAGGGGPAGGQWNVYGSTSAAKPTWFDGSCEFYEPRVMSYQWAGGARTGALQAIGYLWDALVVNYSMPRGTTISYDGGSWMVLTESADPGLMIKVA